MLPVALPPGLEAGDWVLSVGVAVNTSLYAWLRHPCLRHPRLTAPSLPPPHFLRGLLITKCLKLILINHLTFLARWLRLEKSKCCTDKVGCAAASASVG